MEVRKADLSGIRNIVFDLGRVLLDIDPKRTQVALFNLGFKPNAAQSGPKDDEVVLKLEDGSITEDEFINAVLSAVHEGKTSSDVINAWNAMLLEMPDNHVKTLQKLKPEYNIYLLSNSNIIHFKSYTEHFFTRYGFDMKELFNKMWFSFEIGLVKPDPEIFKYILKDEKLLPDATLFIDDTLVHIEAAKSIGIRTIHLNEGMDVSDLF